MDPLDIRRNRPAETNAKRPLRETASQTAGPYVHIGCLPDMAGIKRIFPQDLTSYGAGQENENIVISGQVFDGDGTVCKDTMLEFWQPLPDDDEHTGQWRRAATDIQTGFFEVTTAMPQSMSDLAGNKIAPFITVWITARGINTGLFTRIYFAVDDGDPQLRLVDEDRRHTLIAKLLEKAGLYRFDIHLQGDRETVFFDI